MSMLSPNMCNFRNNQKMKTLKHKDSNITKI